MNPPDTPAQPPAEQGKTPLPTAVLARELMAWSVLPLGPGTNQAMFHAVAREAAERLAALAADKERLAAMEQAAASLAINWEHTSRVLKQVASLANINSHTQRMIIAAHDNMLDPLQRLDTAREQGKGV